MPEQVHGHEVMQMMLADGKVYTQATLCAAITARFGESARFYTCSADNMTAAELVAFLDARGKFLHQGEQFTTARDRICQDG